VLFWRVAIGADPVPHRPGAVGRLLYLLLFSAPMGATGTWLMWSSTPWYAGYSLADQRDAGALMLVAGGLALAATTVVAAWAAILREHRRRLAYEEAIAR
jgi:cytochrome c oxidase assembly factor CtaG